MLSFLRRNAEKMLFAFGVALAIFAYGVAAAKYDLFPHRTLQAAFAAARDWKDNWRHYFGIRSNWVQDSSREGGVTIHDKDRAWAGQTFISLYRNGAFGGVLMDMDGKILHEWTLPLEDIWREAGYEKAPMPDVDAAPHGVEMLPNGDVVMALAGGALVRLDACSRVVWSLPLRAHHSVDVLPNGEILVPTTRDYTAPNPKWPRLRVGETGYFEDGILTWVTPDGKVRQDVSISDLIYDSDWMALLFAGRGSAYAMAETDPYHLNDVEMLRPEMAAAFPMFEAGDLLVDLRNLQTMMVVDGKTHRIKWKMTGPFFGEHDPDFAPNGRIIMFDNRISGHQPQLGYSKVMEIDPATKNVVWTYSGTDEDPFYSDIGGRVQWLPNGNILVGEPQGGRVFELARDADGKGEIVWQYVNQIAPGTIGMLFDTQRVADITEPWVGKSCN